MRVLQTSVICIGAVVLALGACGRPGASGKAEGEACTAASECESQVCTNGVCATTGSPSDGGTDPATDGGTDPSTAPTPFPRASACNDTTFQASTTRKPADIIFVIDNSGSMTQEITAVQNNINSSFAQIIGDSGVDYQVIMLARHGSASTNQSVCISSPLSSISCSPTIPPQPGNTAKFHQFSLEIASTDSFARLLASYDTNSITNTDTYNPSTGWKTWLRPEASKTIIEITDDNSAMTAANFETQLFAKAPDQFFLNNDSTKRNYVFHSIVGVKEKTPATDAYAAAEPLVTSACSTAYNGATGTEYQKLSRLTGGLRYPVCETTNYDAVFRAAAQAVVAGSQVSCDFTPPAAPEGQTYNGAFVVYEANGTAAPAYFYEKTDTAACGSDDGFVRDPVSAKVSLCPTSCTKIQNDQAAKLSFVYSCGTIFTKPSFP